MPTTKKENIDQDIDDSYLKILTVKEAVESKGEKYWEPGVGKSFKGEVHPLARAITVESCDETQ